MSILGPLNVSKSAGMKIVGSNTRRKEIVVRTDRLLQRILERLKKNRKFLAIKNKKSPLSIVPA
jgi:hypothetical protein